MSAKHGVTVSPGAMSGHWGAVAANRVRYARPGLKVKFCVDIIWGFICFSVTAAIFY